MSFFSNPNTYPLWSHLHVKTFQLPNLMEHLSSMTHEEIKNKRLDSVLISFKSSAGYSWCFFHFPFFSCDQEALSTLQSVLLSLCLYVCHTFFSQSSSHRIIMKFSGVITNDKSDVDAKKSKVKVTEVKPQLKRLRAVTLV